MVLVRTALRLRDDSVHDLQAEQVGCGDAQRGRGARRLRCVLEENRRAAFRADHGVVRVLHHQHPVADGERERAAAAALAGDDHDGGHAET